MFKRHMFFVICRFAWLFRWGVAALTAKDSEERNSALNTMSSHCYVIEHSYSSYTKEVDNNE